MKKHGIVFFADRLPPLTGGMEMHAKYFIDYFTDHLEFPILGIVTKNSEFGDYLISKQAHYQIDISTLPYLFDPTIVFFNSGRWIEELGEIKTLFSRAKFVYRTGGNEIVQAPLVHNQILDHSLRQSYWAKNLNTTIDLLITNSRYTENRLRDLGVTCLFERLVGGVNISALREQALMNDQPQAGRSKPLTIFCAARFVPYKNHSFMLSVVKQLIARGHRLHLKLAGDGPLLESAQDQVLRDGLSSVVDFLGVLENNETCREITKADIYMQLSNDQIINVVGGSYVHSEGMGRSILEAITAGTFVVAGDSGALPEIISPDVGLLVNVYNLEEATDQIESILKNLPIRKPFNERFGWSKLFKRYEELFQDKI